MSALLDDPKLGVRDERRNLLMLSDWTPTILAPDHHEGRAPDRPQEGSGVCAIEKCADLPMMPLRRRPHHHGLKRFHQKRIHATIGGSQRSAKGAHPLLKCKIDEHLPIGFFSVAHRVKHLCRVILRSGATRNISRATRAPIECPITTTGPSRRPRAARAISKLSSCDKSATATSACDFNVAVWAAHMLTSHRRPGTRTTGKDRAFREGS